MITNIKSSKNNIFSISNTLILFNIVKNTLSNFQNSSSSLEFIDNSSNNSLENLVVDFSYESMYSDDIKFINEFVKCYQKYLLPQINLLEFNEKLKNRKNIVFLVDNSKSMNQNIQLKENEKHYFELLELFRENKNFFNITKKNELIFIAVGMLYILSKINDPDNVLAVDVHFLNDIKIDNSDNFKCINNVLGSQENLEKCLKALAVETSGERAYVSELTDIFEEYKRYEYTHIILFTDGKPYGNSKIDTQRNFKKLVKKYMPMEENEKKINESKFTINIIPFTVKSGKIDYFKDIWIKNSNISLFYDLNREFKKLDLENINENSNFKILGFIFLKALIGVLDPNISNSGYDSCDCCCFEFICKRNNHN